jgi:hypothetical protein
MIIAAGIGCVEVRGIGAALVMVEAAGIPTEICITVKLPSFNVRLCTEQDSIAEAEDFFVLGMKAGAKFALGSGFNDAPELIGMAGDLANPNALPAPWETVRRVGISSSRGFPFLLKAGAATHQQAGEQQE